MSYYLRDVEEKMAAIRAEVPDAQLERWQDYGFRLTARRSDGMVMTVMQPYRQGVQDEVNESAEAAIKFLRREL